MTRWVNFHGVGIPDRPLDPGEEHVWLGADHFGAVLDMLADVGRDIHISFDDGNASDVDIALPALRERGLRAAFFVLAGKLGQHGYLSASGVAELATAGMTVGSHGMHHVDWRKLDEASLDVELAQPLGILGDIIGFSVDEAACPFGSYDRRVLARLRATGYRRVYTSDGGPAWDDGWLTARTTVTADVSADAVLTLAQGRAWPTPQQLMRRIAKRLR